METATNKSSIFIYPVKSCRGISVPHAPLTPTGFRWDRQWLIVNQKGRALTQRVEPKLALVQVDLPVEAFYQGWEPINDSYMIIKAPGMDSLKVRLSKPSGVADGVSVWEWSGSALDEGDEASKWLMEYIGEPCRLVRFNAASETRPVDPGYAGGHDIMFSDEYPFMLLSQESLDALNKLMKEPVPINRFRPKYIFFSFQAHNYISRCLSSL
ncbi:MOSC domain-containing protein 2 [Hibiscus syriacus]|uniref:MOSC domain-containing protein 2 n=1 Tax=Hibiscus syriacus TaxID=106335 RepID=A0A6A2Y0L8_HIBSY|nr:MOSC domain-containing protein 2 [Hibiscus syriacus]